MNPRLNVPLRIAAVGASVATIMATAATPALAADGDVKVVNTETVQVNTSPTGEVETSRVYEQLALTGTGSVDLKNPIATDGLRNLDGFGGFDVVDGQQILKTTVDGREHVRSVSNYDDKLPLDISVKYTLDGKTVDPSDIVGESGALEVQYTVENVTAQEQEVSFPDGAGDTVTKTVNVPIPMVGSLTTTAPSNFTNVDSGAANLAGDGKGGTKLSFTMTLFPPIGSATAVFGYTADVVDGVVPPAAISALPVNPLESPTFSSAATSYKGGADTGIELAEGATEIDANLLKLRDGAGDLLAGLLKLREGAYQLDAGLGGVAAPGAKALAVGAGDLNSGLGQINSGSQRLQDGSAELTVGADQLNDGTGKLNAGAGKLSAGAGTLSAGTGDALAGSKKLTAGLAQINGGLGSLADSTAGLPAAQQGIVALKAGVTEILTGLGDPDSDKSLIGGLSDLTDGLGKAQAGAGRIAGGLNTLMGDGTKATPGLVGARGGVDQVQAGLNKSVEPGGSLDQLLGGLGTVKSTNGCSSDAQCAGTVQVLIGKVTESKAELTRANAGLLDVSVGLGRAIGALNSQFIPGATQLQTELGGAAAGAGTLQAGAQRAKGGLLQVSSGLDELSDGVAAAVTGVLQLSAGASGAYSGSSDLTSGLGKINAGAGDLAAGAGTLASGTDELDSGASKLAAGAGQLNDGASKLADGTGEAAAGSEQLSEGATKLADGLSDAADGSDRLAEGLTTAADGAPALEDGAQRLSDEGTKKLIGAGTTTAQNYGELYATIQAGSDRAQTEDMAFGAPEGAMGLTAYSYEIQGDDGEGGRNLARGMGGLVILAAGAGVFALRRRLI